MPVLIRCSTGSISRNVKIAQFGLITKVRVSVRAVPVCSTDGIALTDMIESKKRKSRTINTVTSTAYIIVIKCY